MSSHHVSRRQCLGKVVASSLAFVSTGWSSSGILRAESPRTTLVVADTNPLQVSGQNFRLVASDGSPLVPFASTISFDGSMLVIALADLSIEVWDTRTMTRVHRFRKHRDRVRSLAINADATRVLSAGNDGQIFIYRTDDFNVIKRFHRDAAIANAAFIPASNRLAAVGFAPTIDLFSTVSDPSTIRQPQQIACDCGDLRAVRCNPSGTRMVVGGRDGVVHLYDPSDGRELGFAKVHRKRITDLMFDTVGGTERLWSVGEDGRVVLTDLQRLTPIESTRVSSGRLYTIAAAGDDTIAVAGSDDSIRLVSRTDGHAVGRLNGHQGSVTSLVSSPTYLYSFGFDATMRTWSLAEIRRQPPTADRVAKTSAEASR